MLTVSTIRTSFRLSTNEKCINISTYRRLPHKILQSCTEELQRTHPMVTSQRQSVTTLILTIQTSGSCWNLILRNQNRYKFLKSTLRLLHPRRMEMDSLRSSYLHAQEKIKKKPRGRRAPMLPGAASTPYCCQLLGSSFRFQP